MADKMSKMILPVKNQSTGAVTNKEFNVGGEDTKNTAGSTDTSSKIFLIGATSQAANPQTYSDNEVFTQDGVLSAKKVSSKSLVALTGSGTAGSDAGSGVSPRYIPSLWTFNSGISVADGEVYFIKIPVAGGTYGVWLSLNNGTNYYPVAVSSGTGRFTTQYGVNTVIAVTYESAGKCNCYAKTGGDSTSEVTGCFRVLNDYDANITYTNASLGQGYAVDARTSAATAVTANLSSYTLVTGGVVSVKFSYDVPASATLNIRSKGAKKIFYRGAAITAGIIKAGDIATFIYDGTQYQLISIDPVSRSAASGGTDLSLVTTGEKNTWNNKAAGDHNHDSRYVKLDDYVPVTYIDELPYDFNKGSAVVLNNEIHILGGYNHYKWNGSTWVSVSTLPYDLTGGSAIVYNNEIHILSNDTSINHYKWNGSTWVSVSTLPSYFYQGAAVIYNNEIHILGGMGSETKHYKWNGSSWTSVSTLPYNFSSGSAIVYNNEIHILGGTSGRNQHYKWNGSSWTSVSTLPSYFYQGAAVIYNNEIHILGGQTSRNQHYKWNGSSWTSVSTLPYKFYYGSAIVYNNEIHILGGNVNTTKHYKWNGTEWTNKFNVYNLDDRYYTESEIDTKLSKTEDLIAHVQTSLTASKAYAVGDQFVYNGLLYEVTAAVASGGTLTINGNCKLADNVTNQILLLTSELNKLKNATRRTQRNITTDLANLPTAVAEQNLEKYGYTIGDYFIGNSGYTYFLADMNTFRGAQSNYAVINQNHISIVVKTGANSKWNESNDTSTGYSGSVLHSYLSGTVLNNIKSDMIALFGGSTGLEHLLSHKLLWTTATSSWDWSAAAQYISALTEPQVYGTNVWSIDGYQTGEAWKHLELFKKFSYMEILGWIWFWLRSIRSASNACHATDNGVANDSGASGSSGVVGLIVFK